MKYAKYFVCRMQSDEVMHLICEINKISVVKPCFSAEETDIQWKAAIKL